MITKSAEDYMIKEAWLRSLLTLGKSVFPGIKSGVKAIGTQSKNIVGNLGKASSVAGEQIMHQPTFRKQVAGGAKAFRTSMARNVNSGLSTEAIKHAKTIRTTAKSAAGLGGGLYLGNKMFASAKNTQDQQLPAQYNNRNLGRM